MSLQSKSVKEEVIGLFESLPICKKSSNQPQWAVRCPFCGDSKKNHSHGHCYIKVDTEENTPMMFHCVKCAKGGIITKEILKQFGFTISNQMESELKDNYRSSVKKKNGVFHRNTIWNIPLYTNTVNARLKLNYINNRLGLSLDISECHKYKIILSLVEFMVENKIYLSHVKKGTINELEKNYIGFISTNGNVITFRDITDKGFFGRFYKLTINPKIDNPHSFYNIPKSFDLMYTDPIEIHIAEGIFDILSVYLNLNIVFHNTLFFANCGYGFTNILKYAVSMGVTTDVSVHIWADNDKTNSEILKSIKDVSAMQYIDEVWIHRNVSPGEKDFGVQPYRISEIKVKLI